MAWFFWWLLIWGAIGIIVAIDAGDRGRNAFAWAAGVLFLGIFALIPYIVVVASESSASGKKKEEVSDRVKLEVYDYAVKHGGEIDLEECAEELDITRETLEETIKILESDGKLERE